MSTTNVVNISGSAVLSAGTTPAINGRIEELISAKQGIRLDIGCGAGKQAGFVGMDMQALPGVDIVHNWSDYPWPLPDECCLTILASHVVEHVNPADGGFLRWMDECWRIMKPQGRLAIIVPYAGSHGFWQDPTHCNGCNETTWSYFDTEHPFWNFYRPKPWVVRTLTWDVATNMEVVLEKRTLESLEERGQDE